MLAEMKLKSELVVLSGCETALGPSLRGEGVIGLARPLFQAGTRSVLATLWRVDDQASAEFMRWFYAALFAEPRATPAAALRSASDHLRRTRRWRDPFFWSGYVLIGS
jgi:CHAT domain-containing protein